MESRKLRAFKNVNRVILNNVKGVNRSSVVNSITLLAESEAMEKDFEKDPLAPNIYQHTWRKAYGKMKEKAGVDPYEVLEIDKSESIKLSSIENVGLLPELLVTISSLV
jgi:hypothetical protein